MKKVLKYILACLVIFSFGVVITADYWRNPNVASIVLVEIEPKKNNEKRSDSNNDLKENLKGHLILAVHSAPFMHFNSSLSGHSYLETVTAPHLSSPDLPPELS